MTMRWSLLLAVLSFAPLCSSEPKQEPDVFAPCEPAVVQALYQTLKDVHDFCTLYDIPYWIDSGTLLGAVRHRGLIPWDDDLDLCIFDTDEQKFLAFSPILHAAGYDIVGMPFGYKIYARNGLTVHNYPWTHPGCDIFIMITDGKKASYKHRWRKERDGNLEVALTDILPLRTYTFGPLIVMGPNNPLPYLKNWYGDDCFTMAYKSCDHATETKYQAVAKKLLNIDDYKTLTPHEPLQHRIKPLLIEQWPVDFMDRYSHLLG